MRTGVSKVYIETYRDGYQADKAVLAVARDAFRDAGLEVSGCVTTTKIGRPTPGFGGAISCYTDPAAQERLKSIFEYTAEMFDEIMIDDFWFTDCSCPDCDAARKQKKVTVLGRSYPVSGDTWEDYRCELMVQLSRNCLLGPAKKVNPKVKLIIKYPQWYDRFHERGYDVVRETMDFDRTWVGTETRNYEDRRWGGTPQYEGYFIMRWLGGMGRGKCGGGWFDPYGTTEATYVEQARQTVLGGAKVSLLFCYGSLLNGTGPKNVEALRAAIPELLDVAKRISTKRVYGIAAYKPPNSHPEKEEKVFDFVGMMGLPLVPCHQFPSTSLAGFFSVHVMKDPYIVERLNAYIKSGSATLITDGLAKALAGKVNLDRPNVHILKVGGAPKSLLDVPESEINPLRDQMLGVFRVQFHAPNRVAFYMYGDGSWVIENFNDKPVTADLNGRKIEVAARGWVLSWEHPGWEWLR